MAIAAGPVAGARLLELWQVTYQPSKKDPNTTNILLQKRIDVNVSSRESGGTITYQLDGPLTGGSLALVAYGPALASEPDLVVRGLPNDGSGSSPFHPYRSNARAVLGAGVFGIYSWFRARPTRRISTSVSFPPMPTPAPAARRTWISNLGNSIGDIVDGVGDYAKKGLNAAGDIIKKAANGAVYDFNQTVNGVAGFAALVIQDAQNFYQTMPGHFINATGEVVYLVGGTLVNLLIHGDLPRVRGIHQDEYDWANNRIFNGTLPNINKIKIFNFSHVDDHRFYTWPSANGDEIYMNLGDAFDDPISKVNAAAGYNEPGQVFIHEPPTPGRSVPWGAWGRSNTILPAAALGQTYDPGCPAANINTRFGVEQQATLVDWTYNRIYYNNTYHGYNDCSFRLPVHPECHPPYPLRSGHAPGSQGHAGLCTLCQQLDRRCAAFP
jgi:hypothetical protein